MSLFLDQMDAISDGIVNRMVAARAKLHPVLRLPTLVPRPRKVGPRRNRGPFKLAKGAPTRLDIINASNAAFACPKCGAKEFTSTAWMNEDFLRLTCACGVTGRRVRSADGRSHFEEVPLLASTRTPEPPRSSGPRAEGSAL